MRRFALCLILGLTLAASPVCAHKIKVFANRIGDAIEGYAYYPGGTGYHGTITLLDQDSRVLMETTTTADGRFRFDNAPRTVLTLVAASGDGHRAEFTLTSPTAHQTETPPLPAAPSREEKTLPDQAPSVALIEEAVARAVQPLAEQLERHEERTRIRDILGGIGYIVGLFGLFSLFKRRSRSRNSGSGLGHGSPPPAA